jgi:hypothetical protein
MDAKEISKLATAVIGLATLVLCFTLFKGHPDLVAFLVPGAIAAVAAVVVPSTGLAILKKKDANGKTIPPAVLGLLLVSVALHGCGSGKKAPLDPGETAVCLYKLTRALEGIDTCKGAYLAISSILVDDPQCRALALKGMKCEGADGGLP